MYIYNKIHMDQGKYTFISGPRFWFVCIVFIVFIKIIKLEVVLVNVWQASFFSTAHNDKCSGICVLVNLLVYVSFPRPIWKETYPTFSLKCDFLQKQIFFNTLVVLLYCKCNIMYITWFSDFSLHVCHHFPLIQILSINRIQNLKVWE